MNNKKMIIALLIASLLTACNGQKPEIINDTNNNDDTNQNNENTALEELPTKNMTYTEYTQEYNINTEPLDSSNLLATYSTSLKGSSEERINNLQIVCDRLNNYILKPGETFSYNDELGPYGPSDGFEEAPILLNNGEKTEGYGGGVCQLSSTLYNVVKNIQNIDITERHHHSSPVSYVPEGEDATVSLQSNLDFKFRNNNDFSIQFKASCDNENVNVWAYQK